MAAQPATALTNSERFFLGVKNSATGTVRRVIAEHRQLAKFHLG
jgi:hypothetical protein